MTNEFRERIRRGLQDTEPDYERFELVLEVNLPDYPLLSQLIDDWDRFGRRYIHAIREQKLCEGRKAPVESLERLLADPDFAETVKRDMGLESLYEEDQLAPTVVAFLHEKFADEGVTLSAAYGFLRYLDDTVLGHQLRRGGEGLLEEFIGYTGDTTNAHYMFYATMARRILKKYVEERLSLD